MWIYLSQIFQSSTEKHMTAIIRQSLKYISRKKKSRTARESDQKAICSRFIILIYSTYFYFCTNFSSYFFIQRKLSQKNIEDFLNLIFKCRNYLLCNFQLSLIFLTLSFYKSITFLFHDYTSYRLQIHGCLFYHFLKIKDFLNIFTEHVIFEKYVHIYSYSVIF